MGNLANRIVNTTSGIFDSVVFSTVKHAAKLTTVRSGQPHLDVDRLMLVAKHAHKLIESGKYFQPPAPITPHTTILHRFSGNVRLVQWQWPTEFHSQWTEFSQVFKQSHANHTAYARYYTTTNRPTKNRPAVVLIHGFNAGNWLLEENVWPIAELVSQGFDVVLYVLPHHGVRSAYGLPPYPAADPAVNCESILQAVFEVRSLIRYLQRNHTSVGLMGMSLGAYIASLVTTLESQVAFLAAITPLASLSTATEVWTNHTVSNDVVQSWVKKAHEGIDVLNRAPRIAQHRAFILAASADKITPSTHSQQLAKYFGTSVTEFEGSHLVPWGMKKTLTQIAPKLLQISLQTQITTEMNVAAVF